MEEGSRKWRSICTFSTGLSNTVDCFNHELLIAKLHVYSLSCSPLKLVLDYLLNRKERLKVNLNYSPWADILERIQ